MGFPVLRLLFEEGRLSTGERIPLNEEITRLCFVLLYYPHYRVIRVTESMWIGRPGAGPRLFVHRAQRSGTSCSTPKISAAAQAAIAQPPRFRTLNCQSNVLPKILDMPLRAEHSGLDCAHAGAGIDAIGEVERVLHGTRNTSGGPHILQGPIHAATSHLTGPFARKGPLKRRNGNCSGWLDSNVTNSWDQS